ncbi:uro-adherence factor A-like [Octopus vulgaris]|uniref:Uro-adherence factor A-like n=1 Tax=Octopus vulgaris TaxID=6645 RepID=A0AA36BP17_OCTVU|nr:uro-adherence factor A-like [Octopus vulgaris]
MKWRLEVHTGTLDHSKTDGNVYFQLVGDVQRSQEFNLDGPGNDFEQGAVNVFQLQTPYLGQLRSVKVSYWSSDGWYLMILKNLITNGTCTFEYNDWFTHTFSWSAINLDCAYVLRSSSSLRTTSRTREMTSSLRLKTVQPSPTYFYHTSTSRTLIESSKQRLEAAKTSTKLHPSSSSMNEHQTVTASEDPKRSLGDNPDISLTTSQAMQVTSLSSMNEHQSVTASEKSKRSLADIPVISLTTSQAMQVTSEPEMSQTSTPPLFTTETSSNTLDPVQVEQTTTGLDPILSSAYVFSTNSISESFSYTPVSSTQEFVSSSKQCIPVQVIENGTPSKENSSCVCRVMNSSSLSKEAKIKQLIKELTVDPKSLSKYKRKKISAPDHRVSAQAIGYVGVVTLVAPFALLVILDLMTFMKYYLGN